MAIKQSSTSHDGFPVGPLYDLETQPVPRYELAEGEIAPESAYQIIHDELMLDGSARLNVATFVTTWMEPQAERLMAECLDKNMIDKDEYPQTAVSGFCRMRTVISVMTPSSPSEPVMMPIKS